MTQFSHLLTRLTSLQATVDGLNLRERLLIATAVVMLLASFWHLGLMQSLSQEATRNRSAIESHQARIEMVNRSLEEQVLQLSGAGARYQQRFDMIQRRLDDLAEKLGDYVTELIDPAEMARVLEGVLKEQSKLRLIRIRNLSPEALSASDESRTTTFYKHGFEIEFEGSYFGCLEYLQGIEALPWRFYWQVLELDVLRYPQNRIRLEVSTLSLDEEWIGA